MNLLSQLEHISCNLCGADSADEELTARDWASPGHQKFYLVKCRKCQLVYLDPRPDRQSIHEYYHDGYYTHKPLTHIKAQRPFGARRMAKDLFQKLVLLHYDSRENSRHGLISRAVGTIVVRIFRSRLNTSGRWGLIGESGSLLDVGCGSGQFIYSVQSDWLLEGKIHGTGVDVDRRAVENARALGIDATTASSEDLPFPSGAFDIVSMKHTLEHMHDPSRALREGLRVLRPGGCIIVEVPNFDSKGVRILKDMWTGIDAPRHLYHFTPETLSAMLRKSGFVLEDFRRQKGTFRKDLSLANLKRDLESGGSSATRRKLKEILFSLVLWFTDHTSSGGAISFKARKPSDSSDGEASA